SINNEFKGVRRHDQTLTNTFTCGSGLLPGSLRGRASRMAHPSTGPQVPDLLRAAVRQGPPLLRMALPETLAGTARGFAVRRRHRLTLFHYDNRCDARRPVGHQRSTRQMSRMLELSFEVANLTDAAERAIDEEFDAVVSVHGATTKVMILVPGSSAVNAAESVISTLNGVGLRVVRLMDDLVTRGEIAKRANVTTQAVGLWTRGQRNGGV